MSFLRILLSLAFLIGKLFYSIFYIFSFVSLKTFFLYIWFDFFYLAISQQVEFPNQFDDFIAFYNCLDDTGDLPAVGGLSCSSNEIDCDGGSYIKKL